MHSSASLLLPADRLRIGGAERFYNHRDGVTRRRWRVRIVTRIVQVSPRDAENLEKVYENSIEILSDDRSRLRLDYDSPSIERANIYRSFIVLLLVLIRYPG